MTTIEQEIALIAAAEKVRYYYDIDEFYSRVCALVKVPGLWLEFGVFKGHSLNKIAACTTATVYGFDSFQGLPEDWRSNYPKGRFVVEELPSVKSNVQLCPGWFDATLPKFCNEHEEPAAFVHIDCDLYGSTKTVLEGLSNKMQPGTIICFDEIKDYPGFEEHELKAWVEFVNAHNVQYRWVYETPNEQKGIVQIIQVETGSDPCRIPRPSA